MAEAIPPVETDEDRVADASPDALQQPLDVPPTEELLAQQLSGSDEQVRARAAAPRARRPERAVRQRARELIDDWHLDP